MTVKLIALYKRPEDVDAFLKHYDEVHAPLVRKMPHLQDLTVSRVTGLSMDADNYFLVAEMSFTDREAFDEAMASPESRATRKDLMGFAGDLVTMMVAEPR